MNARVYRQRCSRPAIGPRPHPTDEGKKKRVRIAHGAHARARTRKSGPPALALSSVSRMRSSTEGLSMPGPASPPTHLDIARASHTAADPRPCALSESSPSQASKLQRAALPSPPLFAPPRTQGLRRVRSQRAPDAWSARAGGRIISTPSSPESRVPSPIPKPEAAPSGRSPPTKEPASFGAARAPLSSHTDPASAAGASVSDARRVCAVKAKTTGAGPERLREARAVTLERG
ncbi:hypothetical protein HETIRDRAFT_105694 [Heterobasidion irregulare TC 32-1]|uniref:Uncharacterized protein n=1 Tax=Heterobasidion irregulare (strain TC 32-1) TaxID=747525 RepID=W4JU71_HETIT|nr:uncharacterized protein HETIRDRAFT_105694 [Heterobasidion irregulare TC 32-1]ETW77102.1 hypothetical protein HETIRDRAFT_105694 [Heterobasidion irregulare TC 32-1]